MIGGLLKQYDFKSHVASDVGINQLFLPPSSYNTQHTLNNIYEWTESNKMKLNEQKSSYIIFTKAKTQFTTRLTLNDKFLERSQAIKLLGVWLTEDLSFEKNTREICIKAYKRMSLLTKLKYVGVKTEDLISVYILFIRSITEYCSVLFHTSLTSDQDKAIEKIQQNCLKIILDDNFVSYDAALEMCGLLKLSSRRQKRMLDFSLKCVDHPLNRRLFPLTEKTHTYHIRNQETFQVNFARTKYYQQSSIPQCQRLLNEFYQEKK